MAHTRNPILDSGDDWDCAYRGRGVGVKTSNSKRRATEEPKRGLMEIDSNRLLIWSLSAFVVIAIAIFAWTMYSLYFEVPVEVPQAHTTNDYDY